MRSRHVKARYIEPGSPWQNAHGGSFNGKFRDECLNMKVFYSLAEAKPIVEMGRQSYNHERPRSSLGYQSPGKFAAGWQLEPESDLEWELHARGPDTGEQPTAPHTSSCRRRPQVRPNKMIACR